MWENQVFFVFVFIAVVLFSLACLSIFILMIASTIAVSSIKNKVEDLLDKSKETVEVIQEAAINVNDAGYGLAGFLAPIFKRRKKGNGVFGFVGEFLRRWFMNSN